MCTSLVEKKLKGRSLQLAEIKKTLKLTLIQRKVLYGILLGDAHLSTQDNGKTYRLHVYQSEKHKAYVYQPTTIFIVGKAHLYDLFKPWCLSPPVSLERTYNSRLYKGKTTTIISFKTISSGSFRFYAHIFTNKNTEKQLKLTKKVPKLIHRWLSPISLAYWYMDDKGIKDKKSKAVYFHTQGFSLVEIQLLCDVLNTKFKLLAKPVKKKKEKYQIYISSKSYITLKNLIYPYLIDEMLYKFP